MLGCNVFLIWQFSPEKQQLGDTKWFYPRQKTHICTAIPLFFLNANNGWRVINV